MSRLATAALPPPAAARSAVTRVEARAAARPRPRRLRRCIEGFLYGFPLMVLEWGPMLASAIQASDAHGGVGTLVMVRVGDAFFRAPGARCARPCQHGRPGDPGRLDGLFILLAVVIA